MRVCRKAAIGAVAIALLALPATAGAQPAAKPTAYVVTFEGPAVPSVADATDAAQRQRLDRALQPLDARSDVLDAEPLAGRTAKVTTTLSAAQLASLPGVAAVEADRSLQLFDEPFQGDQWHLANDGRSGGVAGADVGAPTAWATSTGAGVVIAVIDTGTQLDHPDLVTQLWHNSGETCGNGLDDDDNGFVDDCVGWDFGQNDNIPSVAAGASGPHGTHVAGIIAAARNGIGGSGIAPDARIMSLKVADSGGTLQLSAAIAAVIYAADNGARIINASWGTSTPSAALRNALAYAGTKGVLVFAAAGNTGTYLTTAGPFPAGYWTGLTNLVSVAATTRQDLRASFSNYGQVTLAAPGADIVSTYAGGGYASLSGTSMAAPAAAAVAAILRTAAPALTPTQLRFLLAATAERPAGLEGMGSGRVDAAAAIAALAPGAPALPLTPPLTPTPVEKLSSITLPGPGNVTVRGFGSSATVTFSPLAGSYRPRISGYRVQVGSTSVTLPAGGPYRAAFTDLPAGRLPVSVQALLIGPGRAMATASFATTGAASPATNGSIAAGYGAATVSFRLVSAYQGAEPVTGYRVTVGSSSITLNGNQSSARFNDLPGDAPLAVSVTVLHGARDGQVTQLGSVTPLPRSAPTAPTALGATATRGKILVGWRPPEIGVVTIYRVTVGSHSITLPASSRSATISSPAGPAVVSVVATNTYGTSVAATANLVVPN